MTSTVSDQLSELHAAWRRLSRTETEEELLGALPAEICRCGFGRAAVTVLTENVGRVVGVWDDSDPDQAAGLMRAVQASRVSLAGMPMETEMLRRMEPVVVTEIDLANPALARLARAAATDSYVAAPVSVEDLPALMLHADRPRRGGPVTAADADLLGLIAALAGRIVEQTAFRRRIATLRAEVRRANASVRVVLDDQLNAPVQLAPVVDLNDDLIDGRSPASWFLAPSSGPPPTLTRREREVMDKVATGMSNAQIAAALIISEQTVRSHLKRILRKLRASNRAEAVARWISLSTQGQSIPSGPSSAPARN